MYRHGTALRGALCNCKQNLAVIEPKMVVIKHCGNIIFTLMTLEGLGPFLLMQHQSFFHA